MIRGCGAAIRRRASAGPSGWRRPCSQLRSVCTLIDIAWANCAWVKPMKRRSAEMSSPDSICPSISRLRTRAGRARARSFAVSSGISVIAASQIGFVQPLLVLRRPTSTDDADSFLVPLRPNNQDQPSSNRPESDEAILCSGMGVIENLEIVHARAEQLISLFETDTMFSLIRKIFRLVPLDRHGESVSY